MPDPTDCTGAPTCPAEVHVHGCYADTGRCTEPDDELAHPGFVEVITPAALDAMAGETVPLRAGGPDGPIVGTAKLNAGGAVDMVWDLGAVRATIGVSPVEQVMDRLAREYAAVLDRAIDDQLEAAGYAVPEHLDVRKITGLLPMSTELLTPGRVTVPAWRPSRRQRLAWWWQGARERAGELVAGRRFDDEDDDR